MRYYSIYLDLHRVYDALDRDRCLDILVWYGVGPMTLRILQTYWIQIQIEAKLGGRNMPDFQSHR